MHSHRYGHGEELTGVPSGLIRVSESGPSSCSQNGLQETLQPDAAPKAVPGVVSMYVSSLPLSHLIPATPSHPMLQGNCYGPNYATPKLMC